MRRRPGNLQLATLGLLTVAVAAGAFLWSTRAGTRAGAGGATSATGGLLLPPSASPVDAVLVSARGNSVRLERQATGAWTLSGTLEDDADQVAVAALVDTLLAARGGPLLPGTEPGDRRYDFNGPEGVQVLVHRADGSTVDFALGVVNPVTGTRYATGAGRKFCFTVPLALRDRLAALPDGVRATILLPGLVPAAVREVVIEGGDEPVRLSFRDGAWWLAEPADAGRLGPLSAAYQARYDDRRRVDADGRWLRASQAAVRRLVHDLSATTVRELLPAAQADDLAARWQLDPPWRRVRLSGPGLRPHLRGTARGGEDTAELVLGPPLSATQAPVSRNGHVLVAGREAVESLLLPLGALVELGALPLPAREADLVEVDWEGRPLLRGARRGEPDAADGRRAWLADLPAAEGWLGAEADRHGLVRDLVVNLERQRIVAVLPPVTRGNPLRDSGRTVVTLTFGSGPGAQVHRREVGWLREPVDGARAAVWDPATGQLLGIPDDLPITMRNAAELAAPRR